MALIQLPSVVVDEVVDIALVTDEVVAINLIPESEEREVALDTAVQFEIYVVDGTAPAVAELEVHIGGILVLTGGSPIAGWGLVSSNPDVATLRIVLTPVTAFVSDIDVPVVIEIASLGFERHYQFHTIDVIRPHVVAAVGRDRNIVRVTFSEAMQMVDATAASDALNPANYIIDRVSVPAVELAVVSVEAVDVDTVDLITDVTQTFQGAYQLTVSATILDLAGNPHVAAPDNFVAFTGFAPVFPPGRRFLLQDFVPAMNLTEDSTGDLRMMLAILQEVTNVLLSDIDDWARILDSDVAPEAFVDEMLAGLGNPFEFDLSLVDKRRLIRILVPLYKLKGTQPGIVAAIQFFLNVTTQIQVYTESGWELADDGFEDEGDELSDDSDLGDPPAILGPDQRGLYSFRIISPVDLTEQQREQISVIANYMKVGHEHYLGTIEPGLPEPSLA